jgi:uncharacterized protein YndB with AHSA1/START domain
MRRIEYHSIVEANLGDVWQAWTSESGLTSFLGPKAFVDLRPGGRYEVLFDLNEAEGLQGTEGRKIQTFIPENLLAFEWSQPACFGPLREELTWVVIEFSELDEELCEITLSHLGFGDSEAWDPVVHYFQVQWPKVLRRFDRSMTMGAIDWENPTALQS